MVKRTLLLTVLLVMGLMVVAWGKDKTPEDNKVKKTDKEIVITGNNAFALELYAQLRKQEGNLFFSPYSISTALAMTYAGARGETEKQMAQVLHFNPEQSKFHPVFAQVIHDLTMEKSKGYELNVANALWGQKGYGFLNPFLNLTKKNYGAGLREVDFANATEESRKTINAWVEKETRDKIKELIKPGILDRLTTLVLTNAIYFKGNWVCQFDKKKTKDTAFTLLDRKKVNVPLMYQKGKFKYTWMRGQGLQILELPYADNELSMVIFLPQYKVVNIKEIEKTFTMEKLTQWLQKLDKKEVEVFLPKFKLTCDFELSENLKALGMPAAFSLPSADFSGMAGSKELFISAVIHKAFVDVNEEGTEAAAATAVKVYKNGGPVFRADHPFIFMIRDIRSGSILFMGRVMNPKV